MNPTNPGHPVVHYFLDTLPHFLGYFGVTILIALAFLAIYVAITPHKEFALIREGNTAAATQLVGSLLGFAVPMATVISHSYGILDMALWGVVVLVVQLAVFFVISKLFPTIEARINDNCTASGVFIGGASLAFGILQAGCMVP